MLVIHLTYQSLTYICWLCYHTKLYTHKHPICVHLESGICLNCYYICDLICIKHYIDVCMVMYIVQGCISYTSTLLSLTVGTS